MATVHADDPPPDSAMRHFGPESGSVAISMSLTRARTGARASIR